MVEYDSVSGDEDEPPSSLDDVVESESVDSESLEERIGDYDGNKIRDYNGILVLDEQDESTGEETYLQRYSLEGVLYNYLNSNTRDSDGDETSMPQTDYSGFLIQVLLGNVSLSDNIILGNPEDDIDTFMISAFLAQVSNVYQLGPTSHQMYRAS